MFRNRRSARGEEPETDPRFLVDPGARSGRVQSPNYGTSAILLAANPAGESKLLRLDEPPTAPWTVSVRSLYTGGAVPVNGVLVKGSFGSGGAVMNVEFDAKPDTTIVLPGGSIDLTVSWADQFLVTGAVVVNRIDNSILPDRADIAAIACRGEVSRGVATRTQNVAVVAAGTAVIPLPPFADEFMLYANAASLALLTSVSFLTANSASPAVVISTYTAADLAAIRNVGSVIPVPGIASHLQIITNGAGPPNPLYLNYTLAL